MRKLILPFILALCISISNAADVAQLILTPVPKLITKTIHNLTTITSIITAGVYAWALDYDHAKVAFYDGKVWHGGTAIHHATTILQIAPAYPVSGKTPGAWALIKTSQGPAVAYFNGAKWLEPEFVADILALKNPENIQPVSITTSGGAIFLLACSFDDYPGLITHYSVKSSVSVDWTAPQTLNGKYDEYNIDVYNDDNPVLNFLVGQDYANNELFYQLSSTGIATADLQAINQKTNAAFLLTDGRYIYISYFNLKDGGSNLAFRNFDNPSRWQTVVDYPNARSLSELNIDFAKNGLLCKDADNALLPGKPLTFACLKSDDPFNTWHVLPLTVPDPVHWQLLTRSHGAWINIDQQDAQTKIKTTIYDYDQEMGTVNDTHFPASPRLAGQRTIISNFSDTALIACRGSLIHNTQLYPLELYYYDSLTTNPRWQKIDINDDRFKSCGMSLSGTSVHGRHSVNAVQGETMWVFNL